MKHSKLRAGKKNERGWSSKPPDQEKPIQNYWERRGYFRKLAHKIKSMVRRKLWSSWLFSMQRGAGGQCWRREREMSMLWCAKNVVKLSQHILEKQDEMLIREEENTWKSYQQETWTSLSCGFTLSTTINVGQTSTTQWIWWTATTSLWVASWWNGSRYQFQRWNLDAQKDGDGRSASRTQYRRWVWQLEERDGCMAVGFKNQNGAIIWRISYYQLGGRRLRDEEREKEIGRQPGWTHPHLHDQQHHHHQAEEESFIF